MTRRVLAAAFLLGTICFAEKPSLEHLYPTAAPRGGTNVINLTGKFDPWPPKIWCSSGGVEFTFPTNKGTVHVSVTSNAPAGPCLLRLYNDEGASDPAIFVISKEPHIPDSEPNNHFTRPQLLTNFPCTVNGRLDKNNDVDSFKFQVKAGQWLDARLASHTLMSKLDAVLRVVDTNGYQIAWNHDFGSFDPRLVWQAPVNQEIVLQIFGFAYPAGSEIVLSGGNGGVYQLAITIAKDPPADLNTSLQEDATFEYDSGSFFGVICPAGDEDSYSIALKKDEIIEVRVEASDFGSDLDPWVKIADASGKELAHNDDAEGARDALLEWKTPADADYKIVVGSITHRGEEDWRYRLSVTKIEPGFRPTVEASSFALESTGTNEVKVSTKRFHNFTNELTVEIEKLPDGLSVEPAKVDSKSNETTLKLVTREAPGFSGPMRIVVRDNVTQELRAATFPLVSRSENNGVPGGYSKLLVENTPDLWLTIKPPKEKPGK